MAKKLTQGINTAELKTSSNSKELSKAKLNRPKIYVLSGRFDEAQTCNTTRPYEHKPLFFSLNGESTTVSYNTATEEYEERKIRYVKGAKSIFADEQPENAKPSDIEFQNGYLFVYPTEITKMKYLDACSENGSNENRAVGTFTLFNEFKPEKVAQRNSISEINRAEVIHFIKKNFKTEHGSAMLKAYAETLNFNTDAMEDFEIRDGLIRLAGQNPKEFASSLKSSAHNRKYYFIRAIKGNIIAKDDASNALLWTNPNGTKGNQIIAAPMGVNVVDFAVSWSFEKGQKSYELIKQKVDDLELHNFAAPDEEGQTQFVQELESMIAEFEVTE